MSDLVNENEVPFQSEEDRLKIKEEILEEKEEIIKDQEEILRKKEEILELEKDILLEEEEIIDLEEYLKQGKHPPKGKKYRVIIDRDKFIAPKEHMTGLELLILAGKNPPKHFQIRQKMKGGKFAKIDYDQVVDLAEPGIEKFTTIPIDQTDGEVPRRGFTLLEEDEQYLISLNLIWESVKIQDAKWIFINQFPLPSGYNVNEAIIAIRMSPGYPKTQLDMIYFYPALNRLDGIAINALSNIIIDGKTFQQWSRHRTGSNSWRPEVDNLSTHIPLAEAWLLSEFIKRPGYAISA